MGKKNENKKDGIIMDKSTELNTEELKDVSGGLVKPVIDVKKIDKDVVLGFQPGEEIAKKKRQSIETVIWMCL